MLPGLGESAAEEPVAEGLAWGRKTGNELQNDGVRACAKTRSKRLDWLLSIPGSLFCHRLDASEFSFSDPAKIVQLVLQWPRTFRQNSSLCCSHCILVTSISFGSSRPP
jgi:hypothetical protein